MMGTLFCQYETPCGICTRTGMPCTERGSNKPKVQVKTIGEEKQEAKGGGQG